jgi:hypothetical protein
VFGRALRASKIIVSFPPAASQGIVCALGVGMSDADKDPTGSFAKDLKALSALADQCDIGLVGLKHSLYFLPGLREYVMNGIS